MINNIHNSKTLKIRKIIQICHASRQRLWTQIPSNIRVTAEQSQWAWLLNGQQFSSDKKSAASCNLRKVVKILRIAVNQAFSIRELVNCWFSWKKILNTICFSHLSERVMTFVYNFSDEGFLGKNICTSRQPWCIREAPLLNM